MKEYPKEIRSIIERTAKQMKSLKAAISANQLYLNNSSNSSSYVSVLTEEEISFLNDGKSILR